MNDDLILLITFVSTSQTLDKVVLKIEHGLNNGKLEEYEYFKEEHVWEKYKKLLPTHVVDFISFVVEVEEIFEATHIKDK